MILGSTPMDFSLGVDLFDVMLPQNQQILRGYL